MAEEPKAGAEATGAGSPPPARRSRRPIERVEVAELEFEPATNGFRIVPNELPTVLMGYILRQAAKVPSAARGGLDGDPAVLVKVRLLVDTVTEEVSVATNAGNIVYGGMLVMGEIMLAQAAFRTVLVQEAKRAAAARVLAETALADAGRPS